MFLKKVLYVGTEENNMQIEQVAEDIIELETCRVRSNMKSKQTLEKQL